MKIFYRSFLTLIFVFIFKTTIPAQELSIGADVVSRYIWRGFDLGGTSPSIQPNAKFLAGGFTLGFWGAYAVANPNALEEIDFYGSYAFALNNAGSFSLGFTDYMSPNSGTKIGNIHNHNDEEGPGAHFIEANVGYYGPENVPIYVLFNIFFYNVAENPIYFEVGYSTSVQDIGFSAFIGGTPGEENAYYGTEDFNIINAGFKVTKSIVFTDSFSLPIFGSVILNPESETLFYVFGLSL